jgi:hypothetical protein
MFGKKQRRHAVVETLIGSNSKVNGDLHFKGACHVDGTVNGNVTADPDTESALSISDIGTSMVLCVVMCLPASAWNLGRQRGSLAMCITI